MSQYSEFYVIWKIVRQVKKFSFRTLCKIVEIKIGGKTRFENLLKTIIPFALVGYEVIITNSRYALVGYCVTSYPTRAH